MTGSGLHAALRWTRREVALLYPGSFAFVMATGIVSNAFFFEERRAIADLLFAVNLIGFPLLLLATFLRLFGFGARLWRDLLDPRLVFSFFTIVAAADVFGVQLDLHGHSGAALALWLFALAAWLALSYVSFGVLTVRNTERGANIIHGGWLIAIVGTQSLVILGTRIAPQARDLAEAIFVLIHMLWGIGLALYAVFIVLFAQRIFFADIETGDLSPVLWIVMGAAAISTNAGTTLILTDGHSAFLQSIRPFVEGATMVMWAWGTWWIPLLLLLGIWKHAVRRTPIAYTPLFWSLVFPLGMYALASLRLSLVMQFPPLRVVSAATIWVALVAWTVTALGLARQTWRAAVTDPR